MLPMVRPWVQHLLLNPQARDDFLHELSDKIESCYKQALDVEKADIQALRHEKRCYESLRSLVTSAMQYAQMSTQERNGYAFISAR
jgi:hypothetical protein